MYSWILRFIYSFTYYIHLAVLGEVYQISKHGLIPSFFSEQQFSDKLLKILEIHFPVLLIIFCICVAYLMVNGSKDFASFSIRVKSSEPFGIDTLYAGIQIIPFLTFAFREHLFGFWGAFALLIGTVLFLVSQGTFNLSLFLLGYKQYKVKTDNATIWLVCRRKISNFSSSELVFTLQDNVFVRYE